MYILELLCALKSERAVDVMFRRAVTVTLGFLNHRRRHLLTEFRIAGLGADQVHDSSFLSNIQA